jgi:hypothetical protein
MRATASSTSRDWGASRRSPAAAWPRPVFRGILDEPPLQIIGNAQNHRRPFELRAMKRLADILQQAAKAAPLDVASTSRHGERCLLDPLVVIGRAHRGFARHDDKGDMATHSRRQRRSMNTVSTPSATNACARTS